VRTALLSPQTLPLPTGMGRAGMSMGSSTKEKVTASFGEQWLFVRVFFQLETLNDPPLASPR